MAEIFVGMTEQTKQATIAFFRGGADEFQQRLLSKWLLEFTGVIEPPSVASTADERAFSEGKRLVGIVLLNAGNMSFLKPIDEDTDG